MDDGPEDVTILPYDDLPSTGTQQHKPNGLLGRIGQSRVYALEDTSSKLLGRITKRKRDVLEVPAPEDDDDDDDDDHKFDGLMSDSTTRPNAIRLSGPPISHLPTAKIFAYVAHYVGMPPIALEWVNDTTVVTVYKTKKDARKAYTVLVQDDDPNIITMDEQPGRPVPPTLWPPQLRIDKLLQEGEGLSGVIQLRWATSSDLKKKGAKTESQFYKTYGEETGREGRPPWEQRAGSREPKRTRFDGRHGQRDSMSPNLRGVRKHEDSRRHGRPRATKDDLDAELEAFVSSRTEE